MGDLQKIHLAPAGFSAETSNIDLRYCEPRQTGQRMQFKIEILSSLFIWLLMVCPDRLKQATNVNQ